jgi:hypothetical protein
MCLDNALAAGAVVRGQADLLGCIVFVVQAATAKFVCVVVLQRWVVPFSLGFEEQSECVATGRSYD